MPLHKGTRKEGLGWGDSSHRHGRESSAQTWERWEMGAPGAAKAAAGTGDPGVYVLSALPPSCMRAAPSEASPPEPGCL